MKTMNNVHRYDTVSIEMQKKVALKYLNNPLDSLIRLPHADHSIWTDAIEVWHNGAYHLVIVSAENLRKIHWEDYLASSDDGQFNPSSENSEYNQWSDDLSDLSFY